MFVSKVTVALYTVNDKPSTAASTGYVVSVLYLVKVNASNPAVNITSAFVVRLYSVRTNAWKFADTDILSA